MKAETLFSRIPAGLLRSIVLSLLQVVKIIVWPFKWLHCLVTGGDSIDRLIIHLEYGILPFRLFAAETLPRETTQISVGMPFNDSDYHEDTMANYRAIGPLLLQLDDPSRFVRAAVIRSLKAMKVERARPGLLKVFQDHTDVYTRLAAVNAMAELLEDDVMTLFEKLLADRSMDSRVHSAILKGFSNSLHEAKSNTVSNIFPRGMRFYDRIEKCVLRFRQEKGSASGDPAIPLILEFAKVCRKMDEREKAERSRVREQKRLLDESSPDELRKLIASETDVARKRDLMKRVILRSADRGIDLALDVLLDEGDPRLRFSHYAVFDTISRKLTAQIVQGLFPREPDPAARIYLLEVMMRVLNDQLKDVIRAAGESDPEPAVRQKADELVRANFTRGLQRPPERA